MQRKQAIANARRADSLLNIAPRQQPPLVTRVEVKETSAMGSGSRISEGILLYPPRFAR